nr:cobyrinate a,c-diamide synthase [Paludibacter sp.]
MNGFVIAGTNSGCGKTTITMGLLALLAKHGYKVAPFKAGPDFIDPAFHARVAKTKSYNLDQFLMSTETIQHLYVKHSVGKDVAVVEGVMGLYDGMGDDAVGSTAQLSKSLQLPVVLVVNCKSLYQSVAAIVKGFASFDTDLNVAGVILNHVNSADSFAFLKNYIEKQTGVKCIGYLSTNQDFALESRHLGLVQANEIDQFETKVENLVSVLEITIDLDMIVRIASTAPQITSIIACEQT